MGLVEQSIVVGCALEQARDEWKEFTYRDMIGRGRGPRGQVEFSEQDLTEEPERATFAELSPDSTRVTVHVEYDEDDEEIDVSALRAEVNDELARYREFVEGRMAA
jgi:hypothetical protein